VCIAVQLHLFQSTATHMIVCPFLELGDHPRFASVVSAPCLPPIVDQLLPRGGINHFSDSNIAFCRKYLDSDDEQKVFAMLTMNPLNDLIHIPLYFGTVYVLNRPLTRPSCYNQAVRCSVLLCFPALNVHLVFASARSPTHFDVPLHVWSDPFHPFDSMVAHKTANFLYSRYLFAARGHELLYSCAIG
jgi:hypothetical protein